MSDPIGTDYNPAHYKDNAKEPRDKRSDAEINETAVRERREQDFHTYMAAQAELALGEAMGVPVNGED